MSSTMICNKPGLPAGFIETRALSVNYDEFMRRNYGINKRNLFESVNEIVDAAIFKKPRVELIELERQNQKEPLSLKMVCGALYYPKENQLRPKGEDAHFICEQEHTIGVADGVGGWAARGIDSGYYARELMRNSAEAVHNQYKTSPSGVVNPRKVLEEAFSKNKLIQGSSTACILILNKNMLHSVNVGDSGFMVFRNNKILFKSTSQQKGFNVPYQLGNTAKSDRPDSAREEKVGVVPGDVVVLGTDGLLDNMFVWEIEEVLEKYTKQGVDPEMLAWNIADLALYNSFNKFCTSPFSVAANKAGIKYVGGKIDDISVVVAHLKQAKELKKKQHNFKTFFNCR